MVAMVVASPSPGRARRVLEQVAPFRLTLGAVAVMSFLHKLGSAYMW